MEQGPRNRDRNEKDEDGPTSELISFKGFTRSGLNRVKERGWDESILLARL